MAVFAHRVEGGLTQPVLVVGVSIEVVEKGPYQMFHSVLGRVVEGRVVAVVVPIAEVGVQTFPELVGALVDLHGRVLVAMLQVLFELG